MYCVVLMASSQRICPDFLYTLQGHDSGVIYKSNFQYNVEESVQKNDDRIYKMYSRVYNKNIGVSCK